MNKNDLRRRAAILEEFPENELGFLASIAEERSFEPGELLFRENRDADEFYIVEEGLVGLELATPGVEPIVILSIGPSEVAGISWMIPPYRWALSARAIRDTHVIAIDGRRLREQCEADDQLKLWVLQIVALEASKRLHATRVQLLDMYEVR
ncbi:MAG: cyclic nucleotide-binding domain-containing protein [Acidimicrobiia bacterium]